MLKAICISPFYKIRTATHLAKNAKPYGISHSEYRPLSEYKLTTGTETTLTPTILAFTNKKRRDFSPRAVRSVFTEHQLRL